MAMEPITRKEMFMASAAGESVVTPTPVTREEYFLSKIGGGGGNGGVAITTLHINVTSVNGETMEAAFTADKTPEEMEQAAINGPIWCVITVAAGIMAEEAVSFGVPPAWYNGGPAFGMKINSVHGDNGNNTIGYVVRRGGLDNWILDVT